MQLNDTQKRALVARSVDQFVSDLNKGLSITAVQPIELVGYLQDLSEQHGGFVLDAQTYWDWLKAAAPEKKEIFFGPETKKFTHMANFSTNVQAGLWNLQQ